MGSAVPIPAIVCLSYICLCIQAKWSQCYISSEVSGELLWLLHDYKISRSDYTYADWSGTLLVFLQWCSNEAGRQKITFLILIWYKTANTSSSRFFHKILCGSWCNNLVISQNWHLSCGKQQCHSLTIS